MISAYQIGIHLAVTSNVTAAVGQINTALAGINRQVTAMGQHMRSLQQIMNGHGLMRAGERILGGIGDMVRAGADLNTEFTRTLMLGGQIAAHAAEMRRDARGWAQSIPSWNPAQLLALDYEVTTQVGYEEARRMVPMLAMLGTNIGFATGGRDGGSESVLQAYRTVEAVGGAYSDHDGKREFDQEKFERYMNALQASVIASGGLVTIRDLMQATRQGGPSLRGMEPEVLFPYLAELGIQMGASRAGTANMSWAQQFAGGIMTQRTAQGLEHAHLLGRGEYDVRRGGAVVLHDEARRRLAEALRDPPAWVRDVLMPHMQGQSNVEVIATLMGMFGRQTTQRLIADLEQNNPQFWRMRENAAQVPGVTETYDRINATSITQNLTNMQEAWHGLEQVLVDASSPQIIGILHGLTEAIHYLTTTATEHPQAATVLTGLAVATGTLLTAAGGMLVLRGTLGMLGIGRAITLITNITGLAGLGGLLAAAGRGLAAVAGVALLELLGPALAGVGIGLAGIAGITGLAELGAVLTAVGMGLAFLAGHLPDVFRDPDKFNQSERTRQNLERQRFPTAPSQMTPQDGFGPDGRPIPQNQGFHSVIPPAQTLHVRLTGSIPITADGRTIAQLTGERLAAMLHDAPRGSMSPDPSISPLWGAQLA